MRTRRPKILGLCALSLIAGSLAGYILGVTIEGYREDAFHRPAILPTHSSVPAESGPHRPTSPSNGSEQGESALRAAVARTADLEAQLVLARLRTREALTNPAIEGTSDYYRSILLPIFAAPGEYIPAMELVEMATTSPDERVRAMAVKYMTSLCATEESAVAYNRAIVRDALPTLVVDAAALNLAERMTPELRTELESEFFSTAPPMNWGNALSLSLAGSPEYLELWAADFVPNCTPELDPEAAVKSLEALDRHFFEAAEAVALALLTHEDARVRAALVPLLAKGNSIQSAEALRRMSQESHPLVVEAMRRIAEMERKK